MQDQDITVVTTHGEYEFIGKHLPEMEKPNWHYYQTEGGTLYHFRKKHMVCVISCDIDDNNV